MSAPASAPGATGAEAIAARGLEVHFPVRSGILRRVVGRVRAVDGISFSIAAGSTLGLVGESGSGKSTTGWALLGLVPVTGGRVSCFGRDLAEVRREPGALPRLGQIVYQNPYASLNPRMTIGAALAEVLAVHRLAAPDARAARVDALLDAVGLPARLARAHPHELSGGQRQRVAIARALAIEPRLLVLDEVVSALDVSIQGQIINLLRDLQRARGLTYLFISHDLSVVRHVSHRVAVMYGGKLVESAARERVFAAPRHPYTHALLSAVPVPDPRIERARTRVALRSEPPNPIAPPSGCRFRRSCPFAIERCRVEEPSLRAIEPGHDVACHRVDDDEVRAALAASAPGAPARPPSLDRGATP